MPCEHCGAEDADLVRDPFLWGVWDEEVFRWLCERCFETRADDI